MAVALRRNLATLLAAKPSTAIAANRPIVSGRLHSGGGCACPQPNHIIAANPRISADTDRSRGVPCGRSGAFVRTVVIFPVTSGIACRTLQFKVTNFALQSQRRRRGRLARAPGRREAGSGRFRANAEYWAVRADP